jgi:hypothetical protein
VCCGALCVADAEPPPQRGAQASLVVGVESVCRPSHIAVRADQQRVRLDIVGRSDHDIHPIGPPLHGLTRTPAGQIE